MVRQSFTKLWKVQKVSANNDQGLDSPGGGFLNQDALAQAALVQQFQQDCQLERDAAESSGQIQPGEFNFQACVDDKLANNATQQSCVDDYKQFDPVYSNDQCICQSIPAETTQWTELEGQTSAPCDQLPDSVKIVVKCAEGQIATADGKCECQFGVVTDPSGTPQLRDGKEVCIANNYGSLGINCDTEELITGGCSLNVSKLLHIREEQGSNNTLMNWVQDAFLAATSFIGTVLTVSLVIVALQYIYGGVSETYTSTAKKWLRYAIIGFLLVVFSYTIIRALQYIARG